MLTSKLHASENPYQTLYTTSKCQHTLHSLKRQPHTHVLLETAIVHVKNKYGQYVPCSAILDSAAQLHLVTERLVQRFKLTTSKNPTSIRDIGQLNTEAMHIVSLHITSRFNDWHTTANFSFFLTLHSSMTPITKLDISDWKLPTDLQLADEAFNHLLL
jgi:hypothetical protein